MFLRILIYGLLIVFCGALNLIAQTETASNDKGPQHRIIKREYSDTNDQSRWRIKIEYPELRLEGDRPASGFNLAARNMAMKKAEGFREEAGRNTNYYLEILYEIELNSDEFLSVNFASVEYTGGVHPDYLSFTLNYDLKNERELKLTDLFDQRSAYLSVISKNSIEQLKKELKDSADEDRIKSGAGEDLKNFEKWNITKKGLKFTFDPNDVAGFIPGSFETIVPFEKFPDDMQAPDFYRAASVSYVGGNPPNWCRNGHFTNQNAGFSLASVTGKKNARTYFFGDQNDCPNGVGCRLKTYLISGNEVIVSRTYGGFSCVWYQPGKRAETVGWIPTKNLRKKSGIKPATLDWLGEWVFGESNIKFVPAKTKGRYMISGNSFWKGVGDNIHIGELDFMGTPINNKMRAGDGTGKFDCQVNMQRLGKYLIVSDNKMCGGVNVTFDGVYVLNRVMR